MKEDGQHFRINGTCVYLNKMTTHTTTFCNMVRKSFVATPTLPHPHRCRRHSTDTAVVAILVTAVVSSSGQRAASATADGIITTDPCKQPAQLFTTRPLHGKNTGIGISIKQRSNTSELAGDTLRLRHWVRYLSYVCITGV